MRLDDLSTEQTTFIDTHVIENFSTQCRTKRKQLFDRRVKRAEDLLKELPMSEPIVAGQATRVQQAKDVYDTDFWRALGRINGAINKIKEYHGWASQQKVQLGNALAPLVAPPEAGQSEVLAINALRKTVTDVTGAATLPSVAGNAQASEAIKELQRKIKVIKKVAMSPEDRKTMEGLLQTAPDTAKVLMKKVAWFDGKIGNKPVDTATILTQQTALDTANAKVKEAKEALELVKGKSASDYESEEAYQQALKDAGDLVTQREEEAESAKTVLGFMKEKKALVDEVYYGAMSEGSHVQLEDGQRATLIEIMYEKPGFGGAIMDALRDSRDVDDTLAMISIIADYGEDNFEHEGDNFRYSSDWYAENLMKQAATLGPDYTPLLEKYLEDGLHMEENPLGDDPGREKRAAHRTKLVADALIDPTTGKVALGDEANELLLHMLFNADAIDKPTPALGKHMMKAMEQLKDEEVRKQFDAVKEPENDDAKALIRQTLGLDKDAPVGKAEAQLAALTAFLTPVDQGDVGSCFTTAPSRRFRDEHPDKAVAQFVTMVTTGKFKAADGREVPAVVKLNEGDGNALVRSFEYSTAAIGASEDNSREHGQLRNMLFAEEGLKKVKDIVGSSDWSTLKPMLRSHISGAFRFTYDPTIETEKSSDGSSSKGRFVLIVTKDYAGTKGEAITTKESFVAAMLKIGEHSLKEFGLDPGKDEDKPKFQKMRELVSSGEFADAVGGGKTKPWQMSSGGLEIGPTKALYGGTPTASDVLTEGTKPPSTATPQEKAEAEGRRTKQVLDALAKKMNGSTKEMVTIGTQGIHAFSALPQDESFQKVMDPDPTKRAKKIETVLEKPGRKIADTELTKERAIYLYDKELMGEYEYAGEDAKAAFKLAIDTNRPTGPVKPQELRKKIAAALDGYAAGKGKTDADEWKKKQIEKGNTPSEEEYRKKLEEEKKAWAEHYENEATSGMMKELGCPEVKIADTNWGDEKTHTYFVIAPDPGTGELRIWKRTEPDGSLRPAGDEWAFTGWDTTA